MLMLDELFDTTDGLGADDGYYGPGDAGGTLYTDQPTMFGVQLALQRRGFNPGVVDGKFGPNTETALAAFNAQRGSPKMGPPDLEVLHALGLAPGGFQWTGAGIAPGSVQMTPSAPSTPPHIPGTIPVAVPPGTLRNQVGPGAVQLQPQGGGGPGKQGGAGGVLGFLKKNAALLAGGVGLVLVGSQFMGGGGRRPAPRRRRRR